MYMSWADEIKNIRTNLNMTQKEFAEIIGLTSKQISNFERGYQRPKLYHLYAARYLEDVKK